MPRKEEHFWYSEKCQRHKEITLGPSKSRCHNFAMIDGNVVEYNQCTQEKEHSIKWDDLQYLGKGTYHHSERM